MPSSMQKFSGHSSNTYYMQGSVLGSTDTKSRERPWPSYRGQRQGLSSLVPWRAPFPALHLPFSLTRLSYMMPRMCLTRLCLQPPSTMPGTQKMPGKYSLDTVQQRLRWCRKTMPWFSSDLGTDHSRCSPCRDNLGDNNISLWICLSVCIGALGSAVGSLDPGICQKRGSYLFQIVALISRTVKYQNWVKRWILESDRLGFECQLCLYCISCLTSQSFDFLICKVGIVTDFTGSLWRLNGVMVNYMCQLGLATVLRYLSQTLFWRFWDDIFFVNLINI